jgi:hypothetical protein
MRGTNLSDPVVWQAWSMKGRRRRWSGSVLLVAAVAVLAGGCGREELGPAVGVYRFDGERSELAAQLLQLLPEAARERPEVVALVAQKAAEVTGSYDLRGDGSASWSRGVPAADGSVQVDEGRGRWTLDGDKVTLTTVDPGGDPGADPDRLPPVQLLQHLGDTLIVEEERQGVWIRMVFRRRR